MWISVKDKLPEPGTRVLCCGPKGGIQICRYDFGYFQTVKQTNMTVTHWMPLPEPAHE